MMKNNTILVWVLGQQKTFEILKIVITSISVLAFPDTKALFCIKADSLDFSTGVVLSKLSKKDSKWHLVVFFSKSPFSIKYSYKISQ